MAKPKPKEVQPVIILTKNTYTIGEAAVAMKMSSQYVRTLIRRGQIKSKLVPIAKDSQVTRHAIAKDQLENFLSGSARKSKRTDGRNKYVFYANFGEIGRVREVLKAAGLQEVEKTVMSSNQLKPMIIEETEDEHVDRQARLNGKD